MTLASMAKNALWGFFLLKNTRQSNTFTLIIFCCFQSEIGTGLSWEIQELDLTLQFYATLPLRDFLESLPIKIRYLSNKIRFHTWNC